MTINLDLKQLAKSNKAYIIAEIGNAHDGSLGAALAYIDAVAEAGASAVKFQTHIAEEESTKHEKFRVPTFPQDETRYDYWRRIEFSFEQWKILAQRAAERGLDFISTPFSNKAIDWLEKLNVPIWKVGSGDTHNTSLINRLLKTSKPIIFSSGMSGWADLDKLVSQTKNHKPGIAILECTTSYPTEAEDIGYRNIAKIESKYGVLSGLSDHSGCIYPSLAATTLGAKIIEVHAVFSKHSFGPDTSSSLTIEQLKDMIQGIRFIERGLHSKVEKTTLAETKQDVRKIFSRSAFFNTTLSVGDKLDSSSFSMKKPGGGLAFEEAVELIGKQLNVSVEKDDFVKQEQFS